MATSNLIKQILGDAEEAAETGITLFSEKQTFNENAVWCPTGIPQLDFNLGTLGFPVGITEIAGPSRSGKTTLAVRGLANYQKTYENAICIILSSERRDNKEYAKEQGVDVDNVIIISSIYLEDLFFKLILKLDKINEVWRQNKLPGKPPVYIMWDSIGSTISRAESETLNENVKIAAKNIEDGTKKELKHAQMGAFAKNARMIMKGLIGRIYDDEIVLVAINHVTDDFTTGQKTSGGGSWKDFMPTLRLETKLKEHVKLTEKDHKNKEEEVEVAQITEIKVVKNDFGSRRKTQMHILLGYGIVLNDADVQYAIDKGILEMEGKTKVSFMKGKITWTTKRTFYQNYIDRNKFLLILHKKIEQARHKDVIESKNIED